MQHLLWKNVLLISENINTGMNGKWETKQLKVSIYFQEINKKYRKNITVVCWQSWRRCPCCSWPGGGAGSGGRTGAGSPWPRASPAPAGGTRGSPPPHLGQIYSGFYLFIYYPNPLCWGRVEALPLLSHVTVTVLGALWLLKDFNNVKGASE